MSRSIYSVEEPEDAITIIPINISPPIKKRKKKKKKKSFPISPVQLEVPTEEETDDNQNNRPTSHRSRKSLEDIPDLSKSARKPSKSPSPRKRKKKINKASALIRASPRFSTKSKHVPRATTPNPLPRRRGKKARTNSSTVYKFTEYDPYSDDSMNEMNDKTASASDSNRSSLANTPVETTNKRLTLSLTKANSNQNDCIMPPSSPARARSTRHRQRPVSSRRARTRAASCGPSDDSDDGQNNALLKRLKKENKELSKERNTLRKDHGLLMKIESKLRYKLDIIWSKFKIITIDLVESSDDDHNWVKLPKKGDIEGVLDAMLKRFGNIADQFVDNETKWSEDSVRLAKLEAEWGQFAEQYFECDRFLNGDAEGEDEDDCKSDRKRFEMDRMFDFLKEKMNDFDSEKDGLLDQIVDLEKKDAEQQSDIELLNAELISLQAKQEQLSKEKDELSSFEKQYIAIQKQFEEEHKRFERYKTSNVNEYNQVSDALKEAKHRSTLLAQCGRDMESKVKELKREIKRTTQENEDTANAKEQMKELERDVEQMNERLSSKDNELTNLRAENKTLHEQKDFAYAMKDDKLKQLETENECLLEELNALIAERSCFKACTSDKDYHRGDIESIVVSPTAYCVVTCGKEDHSLRIWEPKKKKHEAPGNFNEDGAAAVSEITFVPKQKAWIDGDVQSVAMSRDGVLLAAGASLKSSVNGYVVVWDLSDNGAVLCNVRSRCRLRFGVVHCVELMKYETQQHPDEEEEENEHKQSDDEMNYLLFAGDTTGCILCWNLSCAPQNGHPIAVINGHNDIVNDLSICNNEWLFSVSNDQCLMHLNISGLDKEKTPAHSNVDYVFSKRLFKDDSSYPLQSVVYNEESNELIFGSKKCNIFKLNSNTNNGNPNEDTQQSKYFVSKYGLNTKDVDHICKLKIRDHFMIIQRSTTNYVDVFNLRINKLVKTYQIDDAKHGHINKFVIYDSGVSCDKKYLILCVGIFSKENNAQHGNRSAIKGFRIPTK